MDITKSNGREFSEHWEKTYASGGHLSIWPWTDMVILVNRFANPSAFAENKPAALEIGCGAGANIPFIKSMGFDYYGIDGSATAINICRNHFPELKKNLVVGDFSKDLGFKRKFSLIIDRASLTSNPRSNIFKILSNISKGLNKDGKFVSVTLYSDKHFWFNTGEILFSQDYFTRGNFNDGPFKGIGWVHFFNRQEIEDCFIHFDIEFLEHVEKKSCIGNTEDGTAFWNLVATPK